MQAVTRSRSISAPSATLAASVSFSITTSWLTIANWARRLCSFHSLIGWPSSKVVPALGSTKRGSRLTSVVLPEPEGPTKATISPGEMVRLTPSSARASSSPR